MKTPRKVLVLALLPFLALVAALGVLGWRSDGPALVARESSSGPSFEVHVVKPLSARPLLGLGELVGIPEEDLRFSDASVGAEIGRATQQHLELRAEGWHLLIEADREGKVTAGTRLVFPIELANKPRTLRCRPGDRPAGYLRTLEREGTTELEGTFVVELATCENADTGKVIEWPPRPLTVRGSFQGVPQAM
jgi:hypothetical protein